MLPRERERASERIIPLRVALSRHPNQRFRSGGRRREEHPCLAEEENPRDRGYPAKANLRAFTMEMSKSQLRTTPIYD